MRSMLNCEWTGVLLSCTAIVAVMDSSPVVMLEFANVVRQRFIPSAICILVVEQPIHYRA